MLGDAAREAIHRLPDVRGRGAIPRAPAGAVLARVGIRDLGRHLEIQGVEVTSFKGLLVNFCLEIGADAIVRGLRAVTDFEYELQIAHANADLEPRVDTIFLPTRTNYGFISASLVREIASHGGDVSRYAPPLVCEALARKYTKESKD